MARQVKIEILADARRLNQAFDSVDKRVRTFGGGLKSMAGVVAGSFAAMGVGKFVADSVKGFQDHQKVVAATGVRLKSMGDIANVSADHVGRLADALERKTTVDGDVIQSGENLLLTFGNIRNEVGKGNQIFDRATQTAVDMSAAFGQDMSSSAIQLGKALDNPIKGITALSRIGVSFSESEQKQIKSLVAHNDVLGAQKIILAAVNKQVAGSAAGQATAWGKLVVIYHQVQDAIGAALLPVFNKLVDWLAARLPGAMAKTQAFLGNLAGAFSAAFNGDGITTEAASIIGVTERVGVAARAVATTVRQLWAAFKANGLAGVQAEIGRLFGPDVAARINNLVRTAKNLGAAFAGATPAVGGLGGGFSRTKILLDALLPLFDRLSGVLKAHPGIVQGAVVAYAGFKPVSSVLSGVKAGVDGVVGVSRALVAVSAGVKAAIVGETLAENASTVAKVANKVATVAVTVASKAWAAGQWLVNAALSANPIGLVIVAIAALAAGIIYAYKHSETFRRIVDGALRAIATAGKWMWESVLKPAFAAIGTAFAAMGRAAKGLYDNVLKPTFRVITTSFLNVVGGLIDGAAKAFGWVPGVGPKLREAAKKFDKFRDDTNRALGGVKAPPPLVVAGKLTWKGLEVFRTKSGRGMFATGGAVSGPGTGTSDSIPAMLSNDEHVITAREVRGAGGHGALEQMRAQWRGYAAGGPVVRTRLPSRQQIDAGAARIQEQANRASTWMGDYLAAVLKKAVGSGVLGGPGIQRALGWARGQVGKPYIWGGVGPRGWDCSGFMSSITNVIMGRNPYHRLFATGSFPVAGWAPGFVPTGFNIGSRRGNPGHMAGTLGGTNVESRGSRGVVVGPGARGAKSPLFGGNIWHLAGKSSSAPGKERFIGFDRGGWLKPGLTMAYNGTGRPERVIGPQESAGSITVNIHGPVYGDKQALVATIRSGIREAQRRSGVPAGQQLR